MKPFDYLGLVGKDPKQLDPEAKDAWNQLRDATVFGSHQWMPDTSNYRTKKRWQWQEIASGFGGRRVVLDNLPKGSGKTGFADWRSVLDQAKGKVPRYRTISTPIQGAASSLFEEMTKRNYELTSWPYNPEVTTPEKKERGRDAGDRMPTGFPPVMSIMSGGLRFGQLSGGLPLHLQFPGTDPLIVYKSRAGRSVPSMQHLFDYEADVHLSERVAAILEHIKPRNLPRVTIDSYGGVKVWDEVHVFDPAESLVRAYEKERKKYDHKSAVSRIMKRAKGKKKLLGRQLEEAGARFERNKKAEHAPKSEWSSGNPEQIALRAKRQ